MADTERDAVAYVRIGGVDYAAREHRYSASVLKLADSFSVTLPAPNGRVRSLDGNSVPIAEVATMGSKIELTVADPNSNGGVRVPKLVGVVTGRRAQANSSSGTTLQVDGADLGWWLSGCGQVYRNTRGVKWVEWIKRNLGIPGDAFGWGFQGVRAGNVLNRSLKAGRAGAERDFGEDAGRIAELPTVPPFHIEVGETLDQILIQRAKLDHLLVNVSVDGYLQIFAPDYKQAPAYVFHHRPAGESSRNNVIGPGFEESADSLSTQVECWSTVVDVTNNDSFDPTSGRYRGKFVDKSTLPGFRLYTFTDTEQIGQSRVDARAKWQWQRGKFDSWTYTFYAVGHSQGGVPFVEDKMCELHDSVYGYDGLFYVAAVDYERRLARPGIDAGGAGTRAKITLKRPNLLAA